MPAHSKHNNPCNLSHTLTQHGTRRLSGPIDSTRTTCLRVAYGFSSSRFSPEYVERTHTHCTIARTRSRSTSVRTHVLCCTHATCSSAWSAATAAATAQGNDHCIHNVRYFIYTLFYILLCIQCVSCTDANLLIITGIALNFGNSGHSEIVHNYQIKSMVEHEL